MGRIQQLLNEAQDGQAFANLARAFHLEPDKVAPAVGAMIDDFVTQLHRFMETPRAVAALVNLLGKNIYLKVLDDPVLLGATSTQVAGNKALNIVAGHDQNERMAKQAADAAGISEMISEYLLPVVAAMVIGALAKENRTQLDASFGSGIDADVDGEAAEMLQLPRASGGGGNFSGITSGTSGGPATSESRYAALAQKLRHAARTGGDTGPSERIRKILTATLGISEDVEASTTAAVAPEHTSGATRTLLSGWRRSP